MTQRIGKRTIILAFGTMAAVLAFGIMLWIYYKAPSSYLALDVNPSIEIRMNRLNEVTSIEPVNDDAKQLMADYELTDKNLDTVIKNIVDRMIQGGFIAPDKDNEILITTEENQNSAELTTAVDGIITNYLTEKQVDANIIPQSIKVTAQTIEEAHKNHVSAGKMAIIKRLMDNDSTLKLEDLTSARVSDLVALAKSKNISLIGLGRDNNPKENKNQDVANIEDQNDIDNNNDNDIEENDNDKDDQDKSKIKDLRDRDNEDQDDADTLDQEDDDKDNQHDSDIKDQEDDDKDSQDNHSDRVNKVQSNQQKHSYSQDIKDNENDNDGEDQKDNDYEYENSGDNEDQNDNDYEDQKDNDSEDKDDDDSDSVNTNQTDSHNTDHESDSEND